MKTLNILTTLAVAVVALASATFTQGADSTLKPTYLRCEYLTNPKGLDALQPRLSWILETQDPTAIGQSQKEYRIRVDATQDAAQDLQGELWDSGWIASADTAHIVYQGKLESDSAYYWTVQIKDQDGALSAPSDVAKWTTGLLNQSEWTGKWIGTGYLPEGETDVAKTSGRNPETNRFDSPQLRKTFELNSAPKSAQLFVASCGYCDVFVNGEKVDKDSVLAPNVSNHNYRARYITYDIAPFLKSGKNVIAFWLGAGWSIYSEYSVENNRPHTPIVLAQTDIVLENGSKTRVVTDGSWKISPSYTSVCGNWHFGNFGGEHIDAKLENPDWNKVDFDDSAWKTATEFAPQLEITAQATPINVLTDPIHPVAVEKKGDDVWRVDMGVNFAGWTRVKLHGKPNQTIRFEYSERAQDAMTFNLFSSITLDENGDGIFQNRFNYSSGRWITIYGLDEKPNLDDIVGWSIRTNFDDAATCETSDDLQNWIYNVGRWTYENLSLGGYIVDCPQRERMGYGGDAHATSESGMYTYAVEAFYYEWLQDWRDCQKDYPNGRLPNTAPTYWGGGGPAWGGIVVTLPYTYYLQYGDTRILEENFEMIEKWLGFLESNVKDGLLQRYGDDWSFLGDWLWPGAPDGPNSDTPQALCLNNMYLVFNLETAAKIARIIGREDQAVEWEKLADRTRTAVNEEYYKADEGSYHDDAQAVLALALLAELPSAENKARVEKRFEDAIMIDSKGHIGVGITGGGLFFRYLRQENLDRLAYSTLKQTEYPSLGFMRAHDATTFWEAWELDRPGHSLLHSSYLFPIAWYESNLLGIQRDPEVIGFRKFVIHPPKAGDTDLSFARGSYKSIVGEIKSSWEKKDSGMELSIVVPPNTEATVHVPKTSASGTVAAPEGATAISADDDYVVFRVPSGSFVFSESK
ncbi:MAG: family 78 glycoside hydrolase catalytic domain [Thermoguttaceae bacterium]|jgi:alpha-L-rhamnosidase